MLAQRLTYAITACLLTTVPLQAAAPPLLPSPEGNNPHPHRNYLLVRQQDTWLSTRNAAGLVRYRSQSIAQAEVSLTAGRGGLTDYYESPKTLTLDAAVESYFRISPRTVVFGSISYENRSGDYMTGSAFIDPRRLPFDIVEDSLTNEGRKHRDTYRLTGAVGTDLGHGLSIGGRVDYTAANYAKYKDLRHKNKLMHLEATAGIAWQMAPWLSAGADYTYRRRTESVTFGTYGKGDRVYKSLISYGTMTGIVEQFGSYGYTDRSREMPLTDQAHGAALQIEVRPAERLTLFAEGGYSHRSGYYGRPSPYTITYTNHHGDAARLSLLISHVSQAARHLLALRLESEALENNAETYRELQNETGSNYYEYYDGVKTGNKLWQNAAIDYTGHLGIQGEQPTWTLRAALQWMHRKQTAYLYPYLRRQDLRATQLTLQATRHLAVGRGLLSLSGTVGYQKGSGQPYEDGTLATPSDRQQPPAMMEAFLYREYLWLTAPQYRVGGSVGYAFPMPGTRLNTYVRLSVDHRKANETNQYSNGKDHTQMAVAVGCTF